MISASETVAGDRARAHGHALEVIRERGRQQREGYAGCTKKRVWSRVCGRCLPPDAAIAGGCSCPLCGKCLLHTAVNGMGVGWGTTG